MKSSTLVVESRNKYARAAKVVVAGLLSMFAFSSTVYAADEICPAVSDITATPMSHGYGFEYQARSIRGGWTGENPGASEPYLDKVQFASAAIGLRIYDGKPVHFVACDYEGEGWAGIRMSQRFPVAATPVGAGWKGNFCNVGLDQCAFTID